MDVIVSAALTPLLGVFISPATVLALADHGTAALGRQVMPSVWALENGGVWSHHQEEALTVCFLYHSMHVQTPGQ